MAKAQKQISRARKARKTVSTVPEMIRAFGGVKATADAFHMTVKSIQQMKKFGFPCTDFLGLYMGLQARGFEPAPKLFGVKSLSELPGA